MSTWKALTKSFSAVFGKKRDITSMEVRSPGANKITLKSSSTLLNVDLTNHMAYITNAKPPPPPTARLMLLVSNAEVPNAEVPKASERYTPKASERYTNSRNTGSKSPSSTSVCSTKSAQSSPLLSFIPYLSTTSVSTLLNDVTESTNHTATYLPSQSPAPAHSGDNESDQLIVRRRSFHHMASYCKNTRFLWSARTSSAPRQQVGSVQSPNSIESADSIKTLEWEYQQYLRATSGYFKDDITFGGLIYVWDHQAVKVEVVDSDSNSPTVLDPCAVHKLEISAVQPRKMKPSGKLSISHVHRRLARRFSLATTEIQ